MGGVEPWWMARWKARAEFLLSVMNFVLQHAQCPHCKRCISYSNSVRPSVCPSVTSRYCVKTHCLQEWVCHLEPRFQKEGVVLGENFSGF